MLFVPKPYPQEFRDDVVRVARNRDERATNPQTALQNPNVGSSPRSRPDCTCNCPTASSMSGHQIDDIAASASAAGQSPPSATTGLAISIQSALSKQAPNRGSVRE